MATATRIAETDLRRFLLGGGFSAAVLLAWEVYSRQDAGNLRLFSSPTEVAQTFVAMITSSSFWSPHVVASAQGFALGWLIAIACSLALGIAMGWFGSVRDTLEPLIFAVKTAPGIALIPLFVVWFGFGLSYKIAVVAFVSYFPALINTIAGVRNADPQLMRMARSFGARDHQLLWTVVLPGAIPFILTGLRLSLHSAVIGITVAELYASASGLGYLMAEAASRFQVERIMATVVLVTITGFTINELLLKLEGRVGSWRPEAGR